MKSGPELWAEVSDPEALATHLGQHVDAPAAQERVRPASALEVVVAVLA